MHLMLAGHAFHSDGMHLTPLGTAFFLDAVRPLLEAVKFFFQAVIVCVAGYVSGRRGGPTDR